MDAGREERDGETKEKRRGGGIDPWTGNRLTTGIITSPLAALDDETSS